MKSTLIWLLLALPSFAQTTSIKENLGPTVNTAQDQILPVFSLDGQTLYFSENGSNRRYEIWTSQLDKEGNWQTKQRAESLNPPTQGSKYVFAQAEEDLLLVNGWFEQEGNTWEQSTGLSWYIPSKKRYIKLEIPALQTQARGRFVNAFLHRPTKTLLLSYAEDERRNLYVCQPKNDKAAWTELRWNSPEKLPAPLNSDFDDTTPFIDSAGRMLYFASNRPGGYGQEDIYVSKRMGDSWMDWSPPENLGFGVNSNFAEIYYSISPLQDYSYFVSYKYSYGSGDIFRLHCESMDSSEVIMTLDAELPEKSLEETELSVAEFKPNNLVFLIDRSGSMKSSSKLPLLKLSLKRLIGELRDIDRLTVISFSDSSVIHFTTQGVTQKDSLNGVIDSLIASGATKANRGLQLAYDYTRRNFIEEGNNEIILVTDGQFNLSSQDEQRIEDAHNITLSVVGLGNDRKAIIDLRKLAATSSGSFIRIRSAGSDTEALLEEVKERSHR